MEVRGEQTVSPEHRGLTVDGLPCPLRANAKRKTGFVDPQIRPQDRVLRAPLWAGWVRCKDQVPLFLAVKSFLHRLPKPGPAQGRCWFVVGFGAGTLSWLPHP